MIGFCCTGIEARISDMTELPNTVDIGLGMNPALVGRGDGARFGEIALEFLGAMRPVRCGQKSVSNCQRLGDVQQEAERVHQPLQELRERRRADGDSCPALGCVGGAERRILVAASSVCGRSYRRRSEPVRPRTSAAI